jgi:hypothetical protein
MAYQLSDLITEVRTRAKDPSFDSSLITSYLQEAQDEVLNRSRFPFMEESVDDTATQGSLTYELDYDVDVILALTITDPDTGSDIKLTYLPFQQFDEDFVNRANYGESSPNYWSHFAGELYWQAPLNKNYGISLRYTRTPIILTNDNDVPDIPERYKQLLIRGALARVEEYRGNFDIAALHERKVEELAEDMLVRQATRQLTSPHKVAFNRRQRNDPWGN